MPEHSMAPPRRAASPPNHRPALKLVKTQDLSRDQWLSVRKGGIGSSDAAARACNVSLG